MSKKVVLDTSIFVEAWTEAEYVDFCKEVIRKHMNYKRGLCYVPVIVPGETINEILKKAKDKEHILVILKEYRNSFVNDNIVFMTIGTKTLEIKEKLDRIRNLDEHDKLIIASAIEHGCHEIITLDETMYNQMVEISRISKEINRHRISIINPKFSGVYRRKKI